MLVIDGHDALIGRNVLSILNTQYQQSKALMSYSCFLKVLNNTSTELGTCEEV